MLRKKAGLFAKLNDVLRKDFPFIKVEPKSKAFSFLMRYAFPLAEENILLVCIKNIYYQYCAYEKDKLVNTDKEDNWKLELSGTKLSCLSLANNRFISYA